MKSEPEQLAMFKRIADGDHRPNEHGLFDIHQLAHLVKKRDCKVIDAGDYGCEIQHERQRGQATFQIVAHDAGLWHPINVFRACREAAGQPHYTIDYAKAKIKNPGGLDEVRIAEIIGADGVRPYLGRPGKYEVGINERDGRLWWNNPNILEGNDGLIFDFPKATVGSWTWPMFCIMAASFPMQVTGSCKSYEFRRAVRALDDAGLLKLTVGPRGGFGTAEFEWLPLAYLQPIERPAPELDPVDVEALASMAL